MNLPEAKEQGRGNYDRHLQRFFVVILGVYLAFSIFHLSRISGEGQLRDWVSFYSAAHHLMSGDLGSVYNFDRYPKGFQFLYPPPALIFYAPLGFLDQSTAWLVWILVVWLSGLIGVFALCRVLKVSSLRSRSIILGAISSGAWIYTVVVGQNSGILFLIIVTFLLLWMEKREILAGGVAGLLMLKPTIGLPLIIAIACGRHMRVILGVCISLTSLFFLSLPLGMDLWVGYFGALSEQAEKFSATSSNLWKHDTVLAFLRYLLDPVYPRLSYFIWTVLVLFVSTLVALVWNTIRATSHLPRLVSLTVLAIVGCSPYLFHYDTFLLTFPAAVWFAKIGEYHRPHRSKQIGIIVGAIYLFELFGFFPSGNRGPSPVGPLVIAWLLLEADDLWLSAGRSRKASAGLNS